MLQIVQESIAATVVNETLKLETVKDLVTSYPVKLAVCLCNLILYCANHAFLEDSTLMPHEWSCNVQNLPHQNFQNSMASIHMRCMRSIKLNILRAMITHFPRTITAWHLLTNCCCPHHKEPRAIVSHSEPCHNCGGEVVNQQKVGLLSAGLLAARES